MALRGEGKGEVREGARGEGDGAEDGRGEVTRSGGGQQLGDEVDEELGVLELEGGLCGLVLR